MRCFHVVRAKSITGRQTESFLRIYLWEKWFCFTWGLAIRRRLIGLLWTPGMMQTPRAFTCTAVIQICLVCFKANVVSVIRYLRQSRRFQPPEPWDALLKDAFGKVASRSHSWWVCSGKWKMEKKQLTPKQNVLKKQPRNKPGKPREHPGNPGSTREFQNNHSCCANFESSS